MKNKNGSQAVGMMLVALLVVALVGGGFIAWKQGLFTSNSAVGEDQQQIINQVADASKTGQVATVGVYVRDISNNNVNTKVAVAVYCLDNAGTMIIDGTSSSTTAEITGKTSIGKTLTCYAFNSTYQNKDPVVVTVDDEYEHIVIDAFRVPTNGKIQFYTDTFTTGYGTANVTAPASGSGTLSKMRITNNNSDTILPLGGVYMDVPVSTNITNIEMSGSATLSGFPSGVSASFVKSTLGTGVSARKELWNYVFEIAGNKPLLVEENDYLESGSITVTADADSCTEETIAVYGFTKGNFRSALGNSIGFGSESDASTPVVISSDITGDSIYCV
jgi:hypothetical protein